jgi:CopG family transcriptional regulator, nickel-responsive regulator
LILSVNGITFAEKGNTMTQDKITRFSVSMPAGLVKELDKMTDQAGFANRSQALAKLVRDSLVDHQAESEQQEIAGTITIVYDHHKPNLQGILTTIQHDHHDQIVSTLHVHLDHDNCLEVLVVRGPSKQIRELADNLIAAKGIKHGKFTVTTTGKLTHHEH